MITNMTPRYSAHTIDGTIIYVAETAQLISDSVCTHIKEQRKPAIAYTFDNVPGAVWPYTTWAMGNGGAVAYIGTPWRTFAEVCKAYAS